MTAISTYKDYSSAGVLKTFCGRKSQAKYCYPKSRISSQICLFINKLLQNILLRYLNNLSKTFVNTTQPAITCSKLTIETLEQGVKYV